MWNNKSGGVGLVELFYIELLGKSVLWENFKFNKYEFIYYNCKRYYVS